jgi:hypothetical protein
MRISFLEVVSRTGRAAWFLDCARRCSPSSSWSSSPGSGAAAEPSQGNVNRPVGGASAGHVEIRSAGSRPGELSVQGLSPVRMACAGSRRNPRSRWHPRWQKSWLDGSRAVRAHQQVAGGGFQLSSTQTPNLFPEPASTRKWARARDGLTCTWTAEERSLMWPERRSAQPGLPACRAAMVLRHHSQWGGAEGLLGWRSPCSTSTSLSESVTGRWFPAGTHRPFLGRRIWSYC